MRETNVKKKKPYMGWRLVQLGKYLPSMIETWVLSPEPSKTNPELGR